MPKVELYINNQLCDLKGDEEIRVDYAIFDISKIDSRGGARSYEFAIPKTSRNKNVLENPEMVNNLSTVPYSRNSALILVDGVDVLIRFCEVSSVQGAYNVRVYGSNSDLFADLKGLKAEDIDLIDLNHYWKQSSVSNSRINTEGYIYPVIDWHTDSPNFAINNDNRVVRNDFLLPAVFYNTVLERLFAGVGFTLINEIETDTENLLITSGRLVRNKDMRRYEAQISTSNSTTNNQPGVYEQILYNTVSADYIYKYWNPLEDSLSLSAPRFIDDVDVDITIEFSIKNNIGVAMQLYLKVETATGTLHTETVNLLANQSLVYSISLADTVLRSSGTVFPYVLVYMSSNSGVAGTVEVLSSTIAFDNVRLVLERPNEAYSHLGSIEGFITPSSILPDVTQVDILKNYMLMFGLLPNVNMIDRTVTLMEFDKILSMLSQAYDWSDKIDWSEEVESKFIFDGYARNNWFRYKQDGEEIKPTGTDGAITIDNKNLELEKDIVELEYAGTNSVDRLVDNPVPNIGVFEQGEKKDDREARVLILDKQTATDLGGNIIYDDTFATEEFSLNIPMCYFILPDKDLNLGFSDNLLSNYYELLTKILNRVKILTVQVRLSAADISQLDFTRPVFIQKFEAYFYISAVKGFSYTESRSTIVELVKLNING